MRREIADLEQRMARLEKRLEELANDRGSASPEQAARAPIIADRVPEEAPETRTKVIRVLVAEPDAAGRAEIAAALRQDGYEVVEAGDGAELLRRAGETMARLEAASRRAVIIARAETPVFAGEDILGFLTRLGWNIPVILLSAPNGDAASAHGAAAVLGGPVDLDCLRAAVRAAVEQ
jgi:CheY-like chemotaxis protein